MRLPVSLAAVLLLVPFLARAQGTEEPRVIVVPVPGEAPPDAGVMMPPPPPPPPEANNPPPPPPPPEARPPDVPPQPPPENLLPPDQNAQPAGPPPNQPPSAMLDGHPREGPFLSGPGSLTFVLHHTLMGGLGVLATQMVPRVYRYNENVPNAQHFCDNYSATSTKDCVGGDDARLAYLAGTLIGAGVGFGTSAFWQFGHWIDQTSANFGLINSLIGGMFGIGFTNLFTTNPDVVSWLGLIGAEAGAWLTAIIGGGELPLNKGLLITSGAAWALIYTALIVAIVATTGGGNDVRSGVDALLLTPAIGAGALALATLKFNPSTAQILRADAFGAAAGAAVLLIAGLVLGPDKGFTHSAIPYALSGVAAAGAITIVSLLWVDAAEAPAKESYYYDPKRHEVSVWW